MSYLPASCTIKPFTLDEWLKDRTRKIIDSEGNEVDVKEYTMHQLEESHLFIVEKKDFKRLYEAIAKSDWFKKAYVGRSIGVDENGEEHYEHFFSPFEQLVKKTIEELLNSGEKDIEPAEILSIAETLSDEARKGWCPIEEKYKEIEEQEKHGFTNGYAQAERELENKQPKWRTATSDMFSDDIEYAVKYRNNGGDYADYDTIIVTNRVMCGEKYFMLYDLRLLPGSDFSE